jgi:predicted CXXCH cytochrome family protein
MARLRASALLAVSVVVAGAMPAGCGAGTAGRARDGSAVAAAGSAREVSSNVRFEDYAGSAACEPCHAEYVESFLSSPMHRMTRDAAGASVRGPFDGTTFHFKGDTARLETAQGARFVTLSSKFGSGIYRVTRVIGGHYREDYVGVPVAEARPDAPRLGDPGKEMVLPVSFVYDTGRLRYKGYSVMVKERPGLRAGPVWNQTCIFCHNTVPYLSTVLGALAGSEARPYQGVVVDRLLPPSERAEYVVTDEGGLRDALAAELTRLGARDARPTPAGVISATRSRFGREHLVEVGIGCESCHLGAREHVRDPARLPTFEPRSSFLEVRAPHAEDAAGRRASAIGRACARCHQVLFSGYEHTWEGGTRRRSPGGSNINSGEARDMLLGACTSKLACSDCHDPHARDATKALRALDGAAKDRLCTRCHDAYASAEAALAHTHHEPAGEGSRCLACHMPKKTMSLDGELTSYHRIGSPTDAERVLLDRPMECALCHQDATVEFLAKTMERWWNKHYERTALTKLYGTLDANVLLATAERGKPHEQGVAFHALGRAGHASAVPVLAAQLRHPIPLVRGYAKRALDAISGREIPVDIDADGAVIEAQTKAWLRSR